jgi:hypothetical protein
MSKFVNVPRPSSVPQGVGSDFLRERISETEVPAIAVSEEQQAPPPLAYTGMSADEDTTSPEDANYYGKERNLFSDDYLDEFGIDTYKDLYPDEGAGAGRSIMDRQGNEIPYEQMMQLRQQEIESQQQRVTSLAQLTRMKTVEDLNAAIGDGVMKPTVAATPLRASKDIGLSLANMEIKTPSGEVQNGLTRLADAYGVTTRTAANMGTLAMTTLMPLAVGNSKRMKPRSQDDSTISEADFFDEESNDTLTGINALLSSDGEEGPLNLKYVGGLLTRESYETAAGRTANVFSKTRKSVDDQGRPLNQAAVPQARISNTESGAAYTQAQIDAGYLTEINVKGVMAVVPTNKGLDYYRDTKELEHAITGRLSARSQKVPVSDTGELVGASRNIRPGDIKKPGYQPLTQIDEGKRIAGSIGKLSSPIKGFHALNMFKMLLSQINNNGVPVEGNVDMLPYFKISNEDLEDARIPDDYPDKKNSLKSKLNLLASEFFHQAGFMADGSPNFTKYRDDYSTHRLYQDAVDFAEQRNKLTRALMVFSAKPMLFGETTYHTKGISKEKATDFWNKIGSKARGRDFNLTQAERELSFLAILGRALDVGKYAGTGFKTENMTIPEMLSIVSPAFIMNAASIGRQLRSLVPNSTKEIVNEILSVAQAVDAQYNRGVKKIPGDASLIKPEYTQNMTEPQRNAMLTWLNTSGRDDYGYTLQAFLDAASYMDAKEQGKPFTPRTTVAIDMNSAGRTFLAMDVGKENILSRVGLIWDTFTNREWQDVTGGKDPRAFFTEVAVKEGLDSAFGAADQEKLRAWKAAFAKFEGNKDFNKSFGKKVLLTTDYGKPMMYHFEEAMAFLNEYPSFKDEMLSHYKNDYKKLVEELNEIYFKTLNAAGDGWQYALPKQLVELMQMFGRVPAPVGFHNERISIGKSGVYDTDQDIEISSRYATIKRKIKGFLGLDPEAKAKDKGTKGFDGANIEPPGPGTAARNGIGPVMGQYRESMVMLETMRYINGDKDPFQMLNMSPVFDNFILDADSYLMTLYVANNIIVPRILAWDMTGKFEEDYNLQMAEIDQELSKQGNTIVINDKSPYKGMFTVLDRNLGYILEKEKAGEKLTGPEKEFKNNLMDKRSGYVLPENRPDTVVLTRAQVNILYKSMAKKFNIFEKLKDWTKDLNKNRKNALMKIKNRANNGEIYFFT